MTARTQAARLQRLSTGLIVLGAASAGAALWSSGHPRAAVLAALALLVVHGWVLALEFVLMVRVNRGDPAPASTWLERLVAWWGEVRAAAAVFAWRQPFRATAEPDHLPHDLAAGTRGVLLVHGFLCNRGLWNPWMRRLRDEGHAFAAVSLEPLFGTIDSYAHQIEEAAARLKAATGQAPVVVAHSMGGLAVRRWLVDPQRRTAAHHVITIGTPHHGTWLGRFAISINAQQMRLNSAWQQGLRQREQAMPPFTCFYGHCDNIVFPASTATLPGADNRHLRGVAHVAMVDHPAPYAALVERLRERSAAGPPPR